MKASIARSIVNNSLFVLDSLSQEQDSSEYSQQEQVICMYIHLVNTHYKYVDASWPGHDPVMTRSWRGHDVYGFDWFLWFSITAGFAIAIDIDIDIAMERRVLGTHLVRNAHTL